MTDEEMITRLASMPYDRYLDIASRVSVLRATKTEEVPNTDEQNRDFANAWNERVEKARS